MGRCQIRVESQTAVDMVLSSRQPLTIRSNKKKSVKEPIRCISVIRVPFERLWSSRSDEHILVLQDSHIQAGFSFAITGSYGHSAVPHIHLFAKSKRKPVETKVLLGYVILSRQLEILVLGHESAEKILVLGSILAK